MLLALMGTSKRTTDSFPGTKKVDDQSNGRLNVAQQNKELLCK